MIYIIGHKAIKPLLTPKSLKMIERNGWKLSDTQIEKHQKSLLKIGAIHFQFKSVGHRKER